MTTTNAEPVGVALAAAETLAAAVGGAAVVVRRTPPLAVAVGPEAVAATLPSATANTARDGIQYAIALYELVQLRGNMDPLH
jgi:hypothetical protein